MSLEICELIARCIPLVTLFALLFITKSLWFKRKIFSKKDLLNGSAYHNDDYSNKMSKKVEVEELSEILGRAKLEHNPLGVSFSDQSLRIDSAENAQTIVREMEKLGDQMEYLNLEGNTLGVAGAEALGKQLEKHPKFTKAIWRDIFTSRSKDEIPLAIDALSRGVFTSGARLTYLDLSDNASGPIGMNSIKNLIRNPCCYTLEHLKLNNMGLGVAGAKLLASAIEECYKNSVQAGTPLRLKVFVAGRNRLENEGASALSEAFKLLGTLEVVWIPQNGIGPVGASQLFAAFANNPNLRSIDMNDNSVLLKGAIALAELLPRLPNLGHLDFGDCLLKNKGALRLAEAFSQGHQNLTDVILSGNEFRGDGGLAVFRSLINMPKIQVIDLGENELGFTIDLIQAEAQKLNKLDVLSISDDGGSCDSDGSYEDMDEVSPEEDADSEYDESDGSHDSCSDQENYPPSSNNSDYISPLKRDSAPAPEKTTFNLEDFASESTLSQDKIQEIISKAKAQKNADNQLEALLSVVSTLSTKYKSSSDDKKPIIEECAMSVYKELFQLAQTHEKISNLNNLLPAYVGIIKNEDKKPLVKFFDAESSLKLLKSAMSKDFFPETTSNIVNFIIAQKGLKLV